MKAIKSILLGSAAGFVSVAAAQAADLPTRKAAPIEYVRVCDAYGSGFFYIPGTETCLRVGGAVVGEWRAYSTSYRNSRNIEANAVSFAPKTIAGFGSSLGYLPSIGNYASARSGDNQGFAGTGRIELDARTATGFGTLRTFIRLESYFGSDTSTATGSLNSYSNPLNGATFRSVARETTILNKAFIQFAGLTAGRVQSFFDFYTDNINWEALRGSNATVGALAYTYTFGGGFSGSIAIEDNISRRGLIGSTIGGAGGFTYLANLTGIAGADAAWGGTSYAGLPAGAQVPEIVANLRVDQPWGAVQVSAAAHQLRTTLYNNAAGSGTTGSPYGIPASTADDYGFAVQLGGQLNLDKAAPEIFSAGDKLWVQAVYERGAVGYIMGNNLSFNGGSVNGNTYYGFGNGGVKADNGWNFNAYDCVWTGYGHCDKNEGWAVLAALKHYWLPTLSSGVFGSYMGLRYSQAALAGFGGGVGAINTDEYRVGTNLIWTPVKNFDIGGEITYLRDNHLNRPVGLAPDAAMWAVGLPSWKGANSTVEGRLRVQRSF